MREAWTDERLDDLTDRVDQGFALVDKRIDRFEDKVDGRFDRFEARFEKLNDRFEWLWRLMLATYVTTLVGLFTAHF